MWHCMYKQNIQVDVIPVFFMMDEFFALSKEDAPENIPMMFITFPSAKDPEAKKRNPGNENSINSTTALYLWTTLPEADT